MLHSFGCLRRRNNLFAIIIEKILHHIEEVNKILAKFIQSFFLLIDTVKFRHHLASIQDFSGHSLL